MTDVRVLIVDDDFRVAGIHHDLVSSRPGFAALEPVHTVGAAREAILGLQPDLLLVDVYLPDGDGVELVRASEVDAFVLSAATDVATVRRAVRAGALAYIVKPFEARTLTDRLSRYGRYRNLLETDRRLSQDDIDRAHSIMHGADATSLSRSATEQTILGALGPGEASAADVAERAGLSRATAQRHLTALAARGIVHVGLRYGSTGRPEHLFRRVAD